ncbi:Aste57867_3119 [Aphanomyces stellatus]|uniref:Aste57867_3119 protein n=1 Tax=Aphanomyces stellatus TaxID=120398 RepID=A0A485KDB7_9STRA|nr:hypothetical protein As57867_003110 [Aphanomyces stellatus]VFT80295.1 Aste57867_3119 [Aphanomyces stellatus]
MWPAHPAGGLCGSESILQLPLNRYSYMMLMDTRKRPHPDSTTNNSFAIKQAKMQASSFPTMSAAAPAPVTAPTTTSSPVDHIPKALLCVLQLQSRTLDRFRANGDWATARNLLVKTELTRRVVVQERRKSLVRRGNAAAPGPMVRVAATLKRVSFSGVVHAQDAIEMDRSMQHVEAISPEEALMVKTMGLQAVPLGNFSEFW